MELPKLNTSALMDQPCRILTLDGGGIRGYSSLLILKEILRRFDERLYGPNTDGKRRLPLINELFDIIVGTSTGGLIALMLVKLGMTVDECIDQYKTLSEKIFGCKRHWAKRIFAADHSKYSGDSLRRFVVDLIEGQGFEESYLLRDNPPGSGGLTHFPDVKCSVVCRQQKNDWSHTRSADPVFLCSHKVVRKPNGGVYCYNCKVADASRGTSAAPTYFSSIEIKNMNLIDGGYGDTNNPSEVALQHYRMCTQELFGRGPTVMINIGTGTGPQDATPKQPWWWRFTPDFICPYLNVVNDSIHLLTQSEQVGKRMEFYAKFIEQTFYFARLSVDDGIHGIALDDWERVNDDSKQGIKSLTEEYLKKPSVHLKLEQLVGELLKGHRRKIRINQDALQPFIDGVAQSPISRTSEREILLPQPRPQSPASDISNNNPGMRGHSVQTEEPVLSMPRTPVQSPFQANDNIHVVNTELDSAKAGSQFDNTPLLPPSSISPSSTRQPWTPLERKTSRISTFPAGTNSLRLNEH